MKIVWLPGDGIGRDVSTEARRVLDTVDETFGLELCFEEYPCGGQHYLETGNEWPEGTFERCRDWADATFLGAIGWPGAQLETGEPAGKAVVFGLRFGLDLYANIRPVCCYPGTTHRVHERRCVVWEPDDVDLVVVRENTEGLYAPIRGTLSRGQVETLAIDNRVITRVGSERIIEAAFALARQRASTRTRAPRVTCVDKSNVLDGCRLFRSVFTEVAKRYSDIETDYRYIDAFCQAVLWEPRSFGVIVTTNMFGDIASDVTAVLGGGLGCAPSAELGQRHGLFEPVHGSAPALAGTGTANPLAAVLSAAMMLEWYGRSDERFQTAVRSIRNAVEDLLAKGKTLPEDLGGSSSCGAVGEALCERIGA